MTVAVLGSRDLDVQSVDVASLRLAGAALAKDAEGRTHILDDINADGYLDLLVQFTPRQMRVGMNETAVVLEGKGLDGLDLRGSDELQPLEAVLAAALPTSSAEERKSPARYRRSSRPCPPPTSASIRPRSTSRTTGPPPPIPPSSTSRAPAGWSAACAW